MSVNVGTEWANDGERVGCLSVLGCSVSAVNVVTEWMDFFFLLTQSWVGSTHIYSTVMSLSLKIWDLYKKFNLMQLQQCFCYYGSLSVII